MANVKLTGNFTEITANKWSWMTLHGLGVDVVNFFGEYEMCVQIGQFRRYVTFKDGWGTLARARQVAELILQGRGVAGKGPVCTISKWHKEEYDDRVAWAIVWTLKEIPDWQAVRLGLLRKDYMRRYWDK